MKSIEEIKADLLKREYTIQFTLTLGHCECSICHSSWWTDNIYASIPLPTGKGENEAEALREAIKDWSRLSLSESIRGRRV